MEGIDGAFAIDPEEPARLFRNGLHGLRELRRARVHLAAKLRGEVIAERDRYDKIAVCQPLHQCAGAKAVRAVIRKIRLAENMEARDIAH